MAALQFVAFDDVHGHGTDGSSARGSALADRLGAPLTVSIGGLGSIGGACWFGLQLPTIRVEARRLIVAQAVAGGEPSETTSQPWKTRWKTRLTNVKYLGSATNAQTHRQFFPVGL
jgi:hypothetical protein